MITRKLLSRLGIAVLALWATAAAIASFADDRGDDLPLYLDDIIWIATLLSTLLLVIVSIAVLARHLGSRHR